MVSDMSFVQTSSGAAAAAGTYVNIGASECPPGVIPFRHTINGGLQPQQDSKAQWAGQVDWSLLKRPSNETLPSCATTSSPSI